MREDIFKIGIYGSFDLYKAINEETINIGLQNRNTDIYNLSKLEDIKTTSYRIIISENQSSEENLHNINRYINMKPTLFIMVKKVQPKQVQVLILFFEIISWTTNWINPMRVIMALR